MASQTYTAELQQDDALGWRWGIFGWSETGVVASAWFPTSEEAMEDLQATLASIGGSVLAA